MKYIYGVSDKTKEPILVIWDRNSGFQHSEIFNALDIGRDELASAGFLGIDNDAPIFHGKSVSLNIETNDELMNKVKSELDINSDFIVYKGIGKENGFKLKAVIIGNNEENIKSLVFDRLIEEEDSLVVTINTFSEAISETIMYY